MASASLVGACGGGTPPAATSPPSPSPAPAPAASTAGPTSSAEQTEVTGSPVPSAAPPSSASASTTTSEPPPPPCVDGQVLMGVCICDKGKSADATGHCVYTQCPSEHGGGTFRDPSTGQCMECRPGTRPTKDGHCEH
ncbi:MAG TPA: hypothetical protein VK762_32090 [Polyangiaceae bacterium]|nr:hypothetical protein [Polyangiaceae bacterium]